MIDRYDCPEIREIWSDENKFSIWRDIEIELVKNLKDINIDKKDYPKIDKHAIDKILLIEKTTKHDVAAFVCWLEEALAPTIGSFSRFVHFGLTSSDIVDTSFSIMIKQTNNIIYNKCLKTIEHMQNFITRHKAIDTKILGRTHGQSAEIVSLRNKIESYCNLLSQLPFRLHHILYPGKLSGSVGDNKYVKKEITKHILYELDLVEFLTDGQIVSRMFYAQIMNEWAILASSIARIATDIRLLSQTGIDEMHEGFEEGQVGSSSMPHKRNPILCENLCGLARVIRGYQTTSMQNIELWNERDISHSSAERIIFPSAAVTLGFMIDRLGNIFKDLVIDKEKMEQNILKEGNKITSQKEMLELINSGLTRTESHLFKKNETIKDTKIY